jgi:GT2 family glycosyltransferase
MVEDKYTYRIAAVVVTYNRLALLQECISSLRNQTRKLDKIIVVNNSSADGTFEWLNAQNDLTIITQENTGSAGGQHTGIKTAYEQGYDWIWCMDDDAEPLSDALEELTKSINGNYLALASSVVDTNLAIQLNHRGYFDPKRIKKGDLQILSKIEDYRSTQQFEVEFASFVGIMLHNNLIKDIGLPDQKLFICHDDVEYCLRIRKICKILVVPRSLIIHKENIENKIEVKQRLCWISQRPLLTRYGTQCLCYRNMFYLYLKYYNNFVGILNTAYNYLVLIRRIILFDNQKYFRIKFLTAALWQAVTNRFNNNYLLKANLTLG